MHCVATPKARQSSRRRCGRGESPVSVQLAGVRAQSRCRCGRSESPVPAQMWQRRAQSRCDRREPSPGADVAAASPVPVQMWAGEWWRTAGTAPARTRTGELACASPARSHRRTSAALHSAVETRHNANVTVTARWARRCTARGLLRGVSDHCEQDDSDGVPNTNKRRAKYATVSARPARTQPCLCCARAHAHKQARLHTHARLHTFAHAHAHAHARAHHDERPTGRVRQHSKRVPFRRCT